MSEAMAAIADGARDQAAGVAEIQAAIGTLDELTQKNAQMADQNPRRRAGAGRGLGSDAREDRAVPHRPEQRLGRSRSGLNPACAPLPPATPDERRTITGPEPNRRRSVVPMPAASRALHTLHSAVAPVAPYSGSQ